MEKKQLNFDRPLLSVRRIPSKLLVSSDERGTKKTIPRRQSPLPVYKPPESDLTQVSKPAAVPFFWEQIPGRPKEEQEVVESESPVESASTPRLLEEGNLVKKSDVTATSPYDSNQESTDEMYTDAFETRSPTESFSFDCSLSGLSGNGSAEPRSSKTFSTDLQTRDFMMKRFLPAAKAMIIDPPQYVSRKHSGPLDQPKQPEKVVVEQRKPPTTKPNKPNTSLLKHNQETEDSESEDDNGGGDNCIVSMKKPTKFRGLFAKFCKVNPLCLLNPIPGLKAKKHVVPTPPPAKEVSRMSRSSHSGPLPRLSDKNSLNMGNVPKMNHGSKSQEFTVSNKNPVSSRSNRLNFSGELQTRGGLSPYRSITPRTISPYRNQKPPSPFRGNGFVSVPKIVRNSEVNAFKNVGPSAPTTPNISDQSVSTMHSYPKAFSSLDDEESIDEAIMAEIFSQDYSLKFRALSQQQQLGSSDLPEESRSTLTPPLPKSPSESWLWKTMPSLKTPFLSHSIKQNDTKLVSIPNSKWETIVKTSNKQHDPARYSEELIPRISQHSKA